MDSRRLKNLSLLFAGLLVLCLPSQQVTAVEKIELLVGDSLALPISDAAHWQLSRRGLVEITQDHEGVWLVLGLRAGLVMARASSSSGRQIGQFLIEVRRETTHSGPAGLLGREPWSSWVCDLPKLSCDRKLHQVRGYVDSSQLFYQIYELCHKYLPCVFSLEMSPVAQSELGRRLSWQKGLKLEHIGSDGQALVSLDCERWTEARWSEFLRVQNLPVALWHRSCQTSEAALRMQVRAVMVDQQLMVSMQNQSLLDYVSWNSLLRGKENFLRDRSTHQLIGQPWLELTIGHPIEIHHGMEIPILSSSDSPQEYWRRLGFVLKATILQRRDYQVQLQLDFSLSQPARDRRLMSSAMQTTIWLPLGEERLVGILDSTSLLDQESRHLILASVPIIGPLFRARQESQGQAQLLLFVKLQDLR